MRKLIIAFLVFSLLAACFVTYVFYKIQRNMGHDISVSVQDDNNSYVVNAHYGRDQYRRMESFVHQRLGGLHRDLSFFHKTSNGIALLDGHINLYVREMPGRLYFRLDREDATPADYARVKQFTGDMQAVLTGKR
ncbi:MAG TPA: hypothetical protein VG842_03180 [Sediminibacterium sp.]|nr:hypothetical protein [Sediminibacterium sp.]